MGRPGGRQATLRDFYFRIVTVWKAPSLTGKEAFDKIQIRSYSSALLIIPDSR